MTKKEAISVIKNALKKVTITDTGTGDYLEGLCSDALEALTVIERNEALDELAKETESLGLKFE